MAARLWCHTLFFRVGISASILCYHSVNPLARLHCVTPDAFEAQVTYLTAHYRVLPLGDLVAEIVEGGPTTRCAAVTFDDGYVDNYIHAFPILLRHRCPATIFIPTAFVEREVMLIDEPGFASLGWQQIREMRAGGIRFGAHSHSHRILSRLSEDEQKEEIARSKSILEDRLGEPIEFFAYPNGQRPDFSLSTVRLVRMEGFRGACSTIWGTRNRVKDVFALKRVVVDHDDDLTSFSLKVMGAYDYLGIFHEMKPWRSFVCRLGGWR